MSESSVTGIQKAKSYANKLRKRLQSRRDSKKGRRRQNKGTRYRIPVEDDVESR
ncbi:hypothetical protein BC829DRAFT_400332 [Chytridium lagenaria]|nr:hypothetical protein BC829DRAFT_400332 [Chytridium lagenaria]